MAYNKPTKERTKPDVGAIIAIVVAIVGYLAILFGVLWGCGVFGNKTPDGTPPPIDKYTITFDMHEHGTAPEDITDATKLPDPLPEVADDGDWTFMGWYLDGEYDTEATAGATISANTTLHAYWLEAKSRPPKPTGTVNFDMHGHGTAPATVTGPMALPDPLPEVEDVDGWHFEGWYKDEEFKQPAEAGEQFIGEVTLHAKWVPAN